MFREYFHLASFALNKELKELYISIGLRSLAVSMVGIFLPLYLYKELSYPLTNVLYFFIILYLVVGLLTIFSAKLSAKIGLKHSILLSVPLFIIYFLLLNSLDGGSINYIIVAFLGGVAASVFWMAFHTDFVRSSDKKYRGREISVWFFISLIAGLLGPFIGGLILTLFNFNILFVVVSIVLVLSAIPLFFSKEIHVPVKFSIKRVFIKKHLKDMRRFVAYGMEGLSIVVFWPLFIFAILKVYLSLGFLFSIVSLLSGVFFIYVGRLNDKYGSDILIKFGGLVNAVSWFVRFLVRTVWQVSLITLIGRFSFALIDLPFTASVYDKAAKKGIEYLIFREHLLCLGRISLMLIVLFGLSVFDLSFSQSLILGFIITGLVSLFYLF